VSFAQNARNAAGEWAFLQRALPVAVGMGRDFSGVLAREPVVGLAKEVVTHLAPINEIEGFRISPEAQDFGDVHFARNFHIIGQTGGVIGAPILADHAVYFGFQTGDNRRNYFVHPVVPLQGANVLIEITGTRGAEAESVNLGPAEAIEVVEDHWAQRRAEIDQLLRRAIELPAFVVGADDENAHVELGGGFNGGPVEVIDEIPVDVEVVESSGLDRFEDDVRSGVGQRPSF
jgi:hypothetical protein